MILSSACLILTTLYAPVPFPSPLERNAFKLHRLLRMRGGTLVRLAKDLKAGMLTSDGVVFPWDVIDYISGNIDPFPRPSQYRQEPTLFVDRKGMILWWFLPGVIQEGRQVRPTPSNIIVQSVAYKRAGDGAIRCAAALYGTGPLHTLQV
jgi:hypothetical protein